MSKVPSVLALIVAAGRGQRVGGDIPKQYRTLAGQPLLARTMRAFAGADRVTQAIVIIHPDDHERYQACLGCLEPDEAATFAAPTAGGAALRQGSVHAGLEAAAAMASPPDIVLIHDAARPLVSAALIERAIEAAIAHSAAIPGVGLTDTVQEIDAGGHIVATLDRTRLRTVQTPQAFRFDLILDAHRRAARDGHDNFTDDGAVAAWAGHTVHVFEGEPNNLKVTMPADFARAEALCSEPLDDIRVAQGFDVHAFEDGDHVWLGGVKIAHSRKLNGHSDADVVLHALTDAVLGAIGDGDIGVHFPPSDPQWRGAASALFLRDAVARVKRRGGIIANLDASIVCEAPKIGPHREAMQRRIAEIAGIAPDRVGIKATTSERLGFTGRGEGIAAFATATVRLPTTL